MLWGYRNEFLNRLTIPHEIYHHEFNLTRFRKQQHWKYVIKSRVNSKKCFTSKQVARNFFFNSRKIKAQKLVPRVLQIEIFNSFVKIRATPRELFFCIKSYPWTIPFSFLSDAYVLVHPFYPRWIFNIHFQSDWWLKKKRKIQKIESIKFLQ